MAKYLQRSWLTIGLTMPDYFNPQSVKPELTNPGLAGLAQVRDRALYERLMGLQEQLSRINTAKEQEDFTLGAGARQAQRDATVRDLPVKSRDLETLTRQHELATGKTEALQPGEIELARGKQALDKGQQGIASVIQMLAQAPPGPDYIARVGQVIKQSRADVNNPMLKHVLSAPNPQEAQKRAQAILAQQSNVDPAYRMTMDKTNLAGQWDAERARITGEYQVRAAHERAKAKARTVMQQLTMENDPKKKLFLIAQAIRDPDIDDSTRAWLKQLGDAILPWAERDANKGVTPAIPGFPTPSPLPNPTAQPGATSAPKPGALPPGVRKLD